MSVEQDPGSGVSAASGRVSQHSALTRAAKIAELRSAMVNSESEDAASVGADVALVITNTVKPSAALEPGADRCNEADSGWSRVRLGANVVRGQSASRTAIVAGGACLFTAWLGADGQLSISAELYGHRGRRLGAFRGDVWHTSERDAVLSHTHNRVVLCHRETDAVLLDVCQNDDELTVSAMDLHTRDGKRCQLDTAGQLAISTAIMSDESECCTGRVLTASLDRIDIVGMITPSRSTS
jgi:hypothetical protein